MALQAGSPAPAKASVSPQPKSSLDNPFFWEKSSLLPPTPLDQRKYVLTIALYAKANIDVDEIRHYAAKPELVLPAPEAVPIGVETAAQQTARAGREDHFV